ncbi:MAG: putative DNA binding domain-containing protein [Deltaproteobacteria bacterium]|nr:putative DNA binding domain-containing protein [Deltaproteobacteria bacterium]
MKSITKLIKDEESTELEFKQAPPKDEALCELFVALANTCGGDLVLGVEDKTKKIRGINDSELIKIEERIANICANKVIPSIVPIMRIERLEEKAILVVHIDMGFQKPYRTANGSKVYVRIGSSTRRADEATEQSLAFQNMGVLWETLPCANASMEDINLEIVTKFLRNRISPTSKKIFGDLPAWLVSKRFARDISGKLLPTNAGVLLFSNDPSSHIPSARLECARFQGASIRDFLDKQTFSAPIWELYDHALGFLRKHIPLKALRTHDARKEFLSYPIEAFREFMFNALVHTNYAINSSIKLAIFDDVIEITNPGGLPLGLTLSDVGTGVSILRNPLIASAFHEMGFIETWGTGVAFAQEKLRERGLPTAQFREKGFFLQVSSVWRWGADILEHEHKILLYATQKETINSSLISEHLGCSARTARSYLAKLANKGLLRKVGTTKGVVYTLR